MFLPDRDTTLLRLNLKDGIEALRRAKADAERVAELRALLSEYQGKIPEEMTSIDHSYDISEKMEKCRKFVADLSFEEALTKFVTEIPLVDLDELKEFVKKKMKDFPMQHAAGSSLLDHKGKSRVEKKSMFELSGEEAERALDGEMVSQFSKFSMPHITSCFIQPAREQIVYEHQPDLYDLIPLVRNNPFIPEHHEGIFLRGLHAGFHGDFLLASTLLIPQIENSIRYVLESHGVETSNLMEDKTQPYKLLGQLFDILKTNAIFPPSLCFELRALLIEKDGPEFRNRLTHGFVTEAECYDDAAVYLWWLVLRICLAPVLSQLSDKG